MTLIAGVSVVICCYNSGKRLPNTFSYIEKQEVNDSLLWEVIIIDNNSSDNTFEIARRLIKTKSASLRVKVISEKRPGLSAARKAGIANSKYQYILFCDDDNWLHPNYVQLAFNILSEDKSIGMLGGTAYATFEEGFNVPSWFFDNQRIFACGQQGMGSRQDMTDGRAYVYGAGSIINRETLKKIYELGIEQILSDRIGKSLVSGGDNELGYFIKSLGYKIIWDDRLKLGHYMPKSRLNLSYIKKIRAAESKTFDILRMYKTNLNGGKEYTRAIFMKEQYISLLKVSKWIIRNIFFTYNSFEFTYSYSFHLGRTKHFFSNLKEFNERERLVKKNLTLLARYKGEKG